ncbi:endolytic transglycosylase MltG [Trueperella bialowiezensis]|uniref:Endolytic murein transglycosylase n=1 Tax=Trueperella bialowiezensis TaxID=312285 RepID=A0A3S5EVX7_9ACTO|nr:endolytic transglycosylase MltG [Trueperella bialowiezensis]VEI12457.1 putative aminodeoxychorismate lyase [Trueperella bialowiezensis]
MSELFDELPDSKKRTEKNVGARRVDQRKKLRRTSLVLFLAVFLIVCSAMVAWPHVRDLLNLNGSVAEDYAGEGTEPVVVMIPENSTGADIGAILVGSDVVASQEAFIKAYNADRRASSIQAGSYALKRQMSASAALAAMLDPSSRAEVSVTIPEGFTTQQVAARLVNVMGYDAADVDALLADPASLGLPAQAGGNVEGWIAPLTYQFTPDTTAEQALSTMVGHRVSEMKETGIPEDQWQRTITVASIVEREVNWPEYYGQVARVIENRIADTSEVGGRLQMDSTVLYAVGKTGGVPTKAELETDSPYNTYLNPGLPPGPISNPSLDVIKASHNPPAGDWLYFVTVNFDTGETKFSNNLQQHNVYVEQLREWIAANPQEGQDG